MHFTGILGSGMSAIAQYLSWEGLDITGSDRLMDALETAPMRAKMEYAGCRVFPQDGSGITEQSQAVVVSTAIEQDNPDLAAARLRGIPIFHRSDLLAAIVSSKKTIAVCGTSGKSTVTAMIFEFLSACGRSPSLLSGAGLIRLEKQGLIGNAYKGTSDLLVIEADESDGSLVKYHPAVALLLNVSKDHKPVDEVLELFKTIASNATTVLVNADDPLLNKLPYGVRFGLGADADCRPHETLSLAPLVRIRRRETEFALPVPGSHNLSNLLAALCVCEHFECSYPMLAEAVSLYQGVARRFNVRKTKRGVLAIDDYAHNPEKIKAAISTAFGFGKRVFAIFQPHGFGPTRFMKNELIDIMVQTLRPEDEAIFLPIYYVGGTAVKDISSGDLAVGIRNQGREALACGRAELITHVLEKAQQGDVVLLMGARDPSLPVFFDQICAAFDR